MDAVCYDAKVGTGAGGGGAEGAKWAGVAVVQRAHGVEEVGYHCGARGDGREGLFVGGFGVPHAEDDAAGSEGGDE